MNKSINQLPKEIMKIIDNFVPCKTIIFIPIDDPLLLYYINVHGIYFLLSRKKVIYIGMSSDLGNRLLIHIRDKKYKHKITEAVIIRFPKTIDLMSIEAYFIRYFNPPYNITGGYFGCGSSITISEFDGFIKSLKKNKVKKWPEKEGWAKSYYSKKRHYYRNRIALCNQQEFFGNLDGLEKNNIDNMDNCKKCLKKLSGN